MENKIEVSKRVLALINELGIKQSEFALRVGASTGLVSGWVNGNPPGNNYRVKICREFGVNRAWLDTGKGEMFAGETNEQQKLYTEEQVKILILEERLKDEQNRCDKMMDKIGSALTACADALQKKIPTGPSGIAVSEAEAKAIPGDNNTSIRTLQQQ